MKIAISSKKIKACKDCKWYNSYCSSCSKQKIKYYNIYNYVEGTIEKCIDPDSIMLASSFRNYYFPFNYIFGTCGNNGRFWKDKLEDVKL